MRMLEVRGSHPFLLEVSITKRLWDKAQFYSHCSNIRLSNAHFHIFVSEVLLLRQPGVTLVCWGHWWKPPDWVYLCTQILGGKCGKQCLTLGSEILNSFLWQDFYIRRGINILAPFSDHVEKAWTRLFEVENSLDWDEDMEDRIIIVLNDRLTESQRKRIRLKGVRLTSPSYPHAFTLDKQPLKNDTNTFIQLKANLGKTALHEQAPTFGCLYRHILLPTEDISPLRIPSATQELKAHAGDWLISLYV